MDQKKMMTPTFDKNPRLKPDFSGNLPSDLLAPEKFPGIQAVMKQMKSNGQFGVSQ